MCSASGSTKKQWSPLGLFIRRQGKKKEPRVSMTLRRKRLRLIRMRRAAGAEMEMLNLRLHLENRRILAENERLRERASTLRRENLALRANLCMTVPVVAPPVSAAEDGAAEQPLGVLLAATCCVCASLSRR